MPDIDVSPYPYPIAHAYQQVLDEPQPDRQFRHCVRAFIAALKYCAMACVGDYLDHLEDDHPGDPDINETIRGQLFRPSLGQWNGFMRMLLVHRREHDRPASAFFDALDTFYLGGGGKPKLTTGQRAINQLISIRNEWFHPVVEPEEGELPRVLAETREALDTLLAELAFLAEFPLVVRAGDGANGAATDGAPAADGDAVVVLRGPHLDACATEPWPRAGPAPEQPVILDGDGEPVRILFLIGNLAASRSGALDWLLFETADINKKKEVKRLKYLLGNARGTDESAYVAAVTEIRERLTVRDEQDRATETTGDAGAIDFAECVTRLAGWSSSNVQGVSGGAEEGRKHVDALYVPRHSFQSDQGIVATFLEGAAPCLAIIGDSGHGKTNLMCALRGHPGARADTERQAVLFLECSTLGSGGLAAEFDHVFNAEGFLAALVRHLQEHPARRVLLLLDGLNEYARPRVLLQEVVDLARRAPNLRLILTCRTVAWQSITQNLVFDESLFHRPDDRDPVLYQFDDDELRTAYGKYRDVFGLATAYDDLSAQARRLMRDPLLLRLASAAYRDQAIPDDPDIPALFRAYEVERKLKPERDEVLLEELVAVMWRRKVDQLRKALTSDSPTLEALVYEDPVGSSGEGRFVCRANGHVVLGPRPLECPACQCPDLDVSQEDWRITYDRVRDEGFLVEDADEDDRTIRFVYDRYLEYRLGLWLVKQHGELTDLATVRPLIDHAADSGRAIFHSALCQTILGPVRLEPGPDRDHRDQLIIDLAASERSQDQETASSCLLLLVRRGDDDRARELVARMVAPDAPAATHQLALRAASDLEAVGDLAVLAPLPPESPQLLEARGQALYAIGRRDEEQERAQRLLAELVERVSPVALARKQVDAMHTLGEVSLRLLGVRNNDPETIAWITCLWQRLLADRLWLGRKNPAQRLVSSGLRKVIVSRGGAALAGILEKDGVIFAAGGGRTFDDRQEEAIKNVLDAWLPGNPALARIPQYQHDLGPESPDPVARAAGAASVLSWLAILACSMRIGSEPEEVELVYSELFTMAGGFHGGGRGTRYSVISGKNFGTMVHVKGLGQARLQPVYDSVIRHWQTLLDDDPGMLLTAEVFKGAPNVLCGIVSESVILMNESLTDVLLRPLLAAADRHGQPELLRAWFKVAPVALNSFSREFNLTKHFLKSLGDEGLDDTRRTADRLGLPEEQVRRWLLESLAILSMGYPATVDAWIHESDTLDSTISNEVANARSRPSEILHCPDDVTLADMYHGLVARWSFADGSIQLLNQYEVLRFGLREHLLRMFDSTDAESYVRDSLQRLLQHVVDGDITRLTASAQTSPRG